MNKITILTNPITPKGNIKVFIKRVILRKKYFGHSAVTRSLIEGLTRVDDAEFNYQPYFKREVAKSVHVLAGVDTLRYAIRLKQEGVIDRLTAGPNIVVCSTDYDSIIASPEIDAYLQPSDWTRDFHIYNEPKLVDRCYSWPAGIDISRYNPTNREKSKVIIYFKDESNQLLFMVEHLLRKKGFNPVILRYGEYKFDDYIKLLDEASFMVTISRTESQGIFLAEAWAMNVPTLCFNPHYYRWKTYEHLECVGEASSAPYLSENTGAEWFELCELEKLLDNVESVLDRANPRQWVIENMTDVECAKKFLDIVINK